MASIELAAQVLLDFDRFFDHLAEFDVQDAPERIQSIIDALDVLARNPYIGRRTNGGNRELVIGSGSRGYVALYRYEAALETVFVLAIRSQRENDYRVR
jgi:plasmid stabilization system protein ParE